jgi:hypothetical protein
MRTTSRFLAAAIGAVTVCAVAAPASAHGRGHDGPPARVRFRAPVVVTAPDMVLLPGAAVWLAAGVERPLYFHAGFWWTPWNGAWYRARAYAGPWIRVAPRYVPVAVVRVPAAAPRLVERDHPRIPHGQWKKAHKHDRRDHRDHRNHRRG